MKTQTVKIIFQDELPEDQQLSITVYSSKTEEGGTRLNLEMSPMSIMELREPSLVSNIYFDVLNTLGKVKESFETGKGYDKVFTLTREEFEKTLTKTYSEEELLFAFVHGGTKAEENKDAKKLAENFKDVMKILNREE